MSRRNRTKGVVFSLFLALTCVACGLEQDISFAEPDQDIRSMRFDFESEDGFRPSIKGCEPFEWESIELGYLDPETLYLIRDSTLGLPGCYGVRETAKIIGEPA